jgi:hypothetical protein
MQAWGTVWAAPAKLHEIVEGPDLAYEKFLDDGKSETITGKIVSYGATKPAEIREIVKVTTRTNFGVKSSSVLNWLQLYGTITGQQGDFIVMKSNGMRSRHFWDRFWRKHIHEFLPLYGQKLQVTLASLEDSIVCLLLVIYVETVKTRRETGLPTLSSYWTLALIQSWLEPGANISFL